MSRRRFLPLALFILSLAILSLSLAGCGRLLDYTRIVEANSLHARGRYQDAVAAYLSVGARSFAPTVDYDLANVYARLGELGAAEELYARARKAALAGGSVARGDAAGGEAAIAADAWFNEGIALYEKGRYEESWMAFRAVIDLRPGDKAMLLEAQRDLELAWRAWKKSALAPPASAAPSQRVQGSRDEAEIRLLRRLETGRWRPGAKSPAQAGTVDY